MPKKSKGWQEDFAKFFENPSREGLRNLLQFQVGERNCLDFKQDWPTFPKLARHILGMANYGSGCLVVGVEEKADKTFDPVGVGKPIDKADIHKGIQKFIPTKLIYEVLTLGYEAAEYPRLVGKAFQVMFVENSPQYIPFVAQAGSEHEIRRNAIYVRRGTATEEANYEELQEMFNRRLETGHSSTRELSLGTHLADLEFLYKLVPRYQTFGDLVDAWRPDSLVNPEYPEESFGGFVARMIREKKATIQDIVRQK